MSDTKEPLYTYSDSIEIAASPSAVWAMVTDMERYGEWSSENTGGYWRKREDGSVCTGEVGDTFVGINRRDGQEWKALVEIDERVENETYAFITGGAKNNFILWKYILEPSGEGTKLTEYWELRNPSPPMVEKGQTEIDYRMANMRQSMRATLEGMKVSAEANLPN